MQTCEPALNVRLALRQVSLSDLEGPSMPRLCFHLGRTGQPVNRLFRQFYTTFLWPDSNDRFVARVPQEEIEIELGEEAPVRGVLENSFRAGSDPRQQLQQLVQRQARFLESLREVRTGGFLAATAQLCHLDTALAQHLWVELLPRLWKVLSDKQQSVSALLPLNSFPQWPRSQSSTVKTSLTKSIKIRNNSSISTLRYIKTP